MFKFPFVLRSKYEKVERDNDRLRVENSNLRVVSEEQRVKRNQDVDALNKVIEDLDAKLKVAEKNDHRDPDTGRFVKG